ncbi:AMP-binding protein [Streptomyces sp. KL116D]|uniref:AMP-binding protein n=1 Tax=Streptomyces sp. KL116D TaxID=3045152 RepID=UPI0035564CF1
MDGLHRAWGHRSPRGGLSPDEVLDTIERERISVITGPPTLFRDLLDSPASDGTRSLLSPCGPGGIRGRRPRADAPDPDELRVEITTSSYGLTEATSLTTTTYPTVDPFETLCSTVGRAALDVEPKIVDEKGAEVPPGTPGELLCRGFNVMRGYWQ